MSERAGADEANDGCEQGSKPDVSEETDPAAIDPFISKRSGADLRVEAHPGRIERLLSSESKRQAVGRFDPQIP